MIVTAGRGWARGGRGLLRRRLRGTADMKWEHLPRVVEDGQVYPARLSVSGIVARSNLVRDVGRLLSVHAPGVTVMGSGVSRAPGGIVINPRPQMPDGRPLPVAAHWLNPDGTSGVCLVASGQNYLQLKTCCGFYLRLSVVDLFDDDARVNCKDCLAARPPEAS